MDLVCEICGAHGGYEPVEGRDVRKMVGSAGCVGGQEKEWVGHFLDDLKTFGINTDQWTTATQDEGGWHRRQNEGRNISWRNGSLQGKPGLDYGMQSYA